MTLAEFRATRRRLTLPEAQQEFDFLAALDLAPYFVGALIYDDGAYILRKKHAFYLEIEGCEYESDDLPLLEFVLWQWFTPEQDAIRNMIWG